MLSFVHKLRASKNLLTEYSIHFVQNVNGKVIRSGHVSSIKMHFWYVLAHFKQIRSRGDAV